MAQHDTNETGSSASGLTRADSIGIGLAIGWIIVLGLIFWRTPPSEEAFEGLQFLLLVVAGLMPLGLIWVAIFAARTAREAHANTYRMQVIIDNLRQTQRTDRATFAEALSELMNNQAGFAHSDTAGITPKPAPAPEASEASGTRFASRREVSRLIVPQPAPQMPADQPSLALDTATLDERPQLARDDMIRALHFPNDENDTEGFDALRRALRDRDARKLVQASQDVLTLLSQDGIYTDDLRTEPVGAEIWRRFAKGERGAEVAQLGTVRDGDTLDVVVARMREDAIFRDAVHHFLRRFDQMVVLFEEQATDTDMLAMAETRTARAFVLLGRATGIFN